MDEKKLGCVKMPLNYSMKRKKARTVFKTIVKSIGYKNDQYNKDFVTKQEVLDFYPELKKMMNNSPDERLYSMLRISVEDPDNTPSNMFQDAPVKAEIQVYGDSEIRLKKKQFDKDGNIIDVLNDKTKEPIYFSVFDPNGETYQKLIDKLESQIVLARKNGKSVEIELSAYKKEDNFNPEYPEWKASSKDITDMKILGTKDSRKLILREDWIKANPDEAKKILADKPEYAPKPTGFKDHESEFKQKKI